MDGATAIEGQVENCPGRSTERPGTDDRTPAKDNIDGNGPFSCKDCGLDFRDKAGYLEHQHSHHGSRDGPQPPLDGSQEAEEDQTTHACASCSLSFAELSDFNSHMLKHHSQAVQQEPVTEKTPTATKQQYECEECGKTYLVVGHFLNHQRSHRQASKSVFHELEQLKKKSFQCETCGRSYSRASALDAHRHCHEGKLVKSHNKDAVETSHVEEPGGEKEPTDNVPEAVPEKSFECSCGKAFSTMARLKTHQRFSRNTKCSPEQLKEKPKKGFTCSDCKKTFNGHIALVNHQRWHVNHSEDGKKFLCEECGKVFMTLTFYYKHQRLAHSDETPAKSFLHQVDQLQKKAFECQDCGLKFSRATALQSHQLCHTDDFRDTEKESQKPTSPLPQHKVLQTSKEETEHLVEVIDSQETLKTTLPEEPHVSESDEDMEGYETGDFNVEVISVSESDEEQQDLNPDLELLCESDHEVKDGFETEVSPSTLASKPDIDLKIVQIDFEDEGALGMMEIEKNTPTERFDCPECYRWFTSASSLRVHRMWHGIRKKKQRTRGQPMAGNVFTCDICGHETSSRATHHNHMQKHEEEKPQCLTAGQEQKSLSCEECGKSFSRMSALISHQLHHPKRKPYSCPDCTMSYSHRSGLYNHRKNCTGTKKLQDDSSETQKVFNPKKTLLGPKIYHCEQCGKGFWSLGAYSLHKQSQTQCEDLRQRKGLSAPSHSANGHLRSNVRVACPVCGRKFRHKGIMKSHMRKHENGDHKCELCSRSFRLFSSLLRHQVVHSVEVLPPPIKSFQHQVEQVKKNTYSCPDCGKLFSRAKALQFHMRSHGYETGYSPSSPRSDVKLEELQCSTCLAHFKNKSSLRAHQKLCMKRETDGQVHDNMTQHSLEKEDSVNCTNCLVHFKNVPSFQDHLKHCLTTRAPKGNMDLKVDHCSEGIAMDVAVKKELSTEKADKADDTIPNAPEKDVSLCATDLKYKCKECNRSFSVVGALNFHKRIHLQDHKSKVKTKLHQSVIAKNTVEKEETEIAFICSECGRQFISNSALCAHKRWHKKYIGSPVEDNQNTDKNMTPDKGPFYCENCGKEFFFMRVLRRHRMYCPPRKKKAELEPKAAENAESSSITYTEFACPECNKTFSRGSLLADHYESEHTVSKSSVSVDGQQQSQVMPAGKALEPDISSGAADVSAEKLKLKAHQCPHCYMAFAKIRGLRAHKWQAHAKGKTAKSKVPLAKSTHLVGINANIVKSRRDAATEKGSTKESKFTGANKKSTFGKRRKKSRVNLPPWKSIQCPDCKKRYSSAGALYNHRKVCSELKKEVQPPQTAPETQTLPPSRLSEHSLKYLFKCAKCGKAFQTEEQLAVHKAQAKSRPYCCALCCHGYWTETQLQQHLAWHDEVRRRLPIELRHRLSASLTSGPPKPTSPPNDAKAKPPISPAHYSAGQSQTSHKCQHCGKAFLSPAALLKHEVQHNSTAAAYHCSICPRTFIEIQDLIDHHQECMGDKGQSDIHTSGDTDELTCLECGTSFSQEIELHQHYIEHARGY